MSVETTAKLPAVQPPNAVGMFDPVIEPHGESMRSGPLTSRLVRVAQMPGAVAAALVPAEPEPELLAADLLVDVADAKPLTYAYLVRVLGWDGELPGEPLADHLSDAAVRLMYRARDLLSRDTDAVLRRAGIGGEPQWH